MNGQNRPITEYGDDKIREIIYKDYKIVYKIEESAVEIITVSYGSKLIEISRNVEKGSYYLPKLHNIMNLWTVYLPDYYHGA